MLQPKLTVSQSPENPNLLLVEDTTPAYQAQTAPGGYGGINPSRASLLHVIFRLTSATGHSYSTAPIYWVSGVYRLLASAFIADQDCGCGYDCGCRSNFELSDGQYDLSYSVYGLSGIPAQTANYHLELNLCYADQVWVTQAGVWTNITSEGIVNAEGVWEWTKFDTTTIYTDYEVRNYVDAPFGFIRRQTGTVEFLLAASPSQPTTTSTEPALIASVSRRLLFMQRSARRLAVVTRTLLPTLAGRRTLPTSDTLLELYTANELLDDIIRRPDADTAQLTLAVADLTQRIDFLETQQTYP